MQTYVTTISYTTNIDEKLNPNQLFGTARALLNNPFVNDMRVTIEVAAQNGTITDMNVILPGENSRYQAERDCMERAKAAGWVQRDGKIFNGHDYINLAMAEAHPDSMIYLSWSECCAGENLNGEGISREAVAEGLAEVRAAVAMDTGTTPSPDRPIEFSPAGYLVGSAIDAAVAAIPRSIPRHDPPITTETGIVTKHVDIRVGDYPTGAGHAGDASGYVAPASASGHASLAAEAATYVEPGSWRRAMERNIAMGDPVETHLTRYPGEGDLPAGYCLIWDSKAWRWFYDRPDGSFSKRFFDKSAAIEAAKLDPLGGRGDEQEQPPVVTPTPTEAFTDAINKALDVLLYDVPGWRQKFHPLASSKGKRALEDLVGLVATIRAELKSEGSKNVTN